MFQVEFQMKQLLKEMQKYHLLKVENTRKITEKLTMSEFIFKKFISVLNNLIEVFISFLLLRLIKVL